MIGVVERVARGSACLAAPRKAGRVLGLVTIGIMSRAAMMFVSKLNRDARGQVHGEHKPNTATLSATDQHDGDERTRNETIGLDLPAFGARHQAQPRYLRRSGRQSQSRSANMLGLPGAYSPICACDATTPRRPHSPPPPMGFMANRRYAILGFETSPADVSPCRHCFRQAADPGGKSRIRGPTPGDYVGDVAQLGEHRLCKAGVEGSIPFVSTYLVRVYDQPLSKYARRCTPDATRATRRFGGTAAQVGVKLNRIGAPHGGDDAITAPAERLARLPVDFGRILGQAFLAVGHPTFLRLDLSVISGHAQM